MYDRLLKLIKEQMPDLDISKASENSRLVEDLGFDSIGLMMLAMSLEDEFGVHFNEVVRFETVKDVISFLEKNASK
ncbi:MAG: acyl carrier protein [Bacilli bacterium]|nr:acyl carrier protein [Bacilli bacterium]